MNYTVHRWFPGALQGENAADSLQTKLNAWTEEEGRVLQVIQVLGANEGIWVIVEHDRDTFTQAAP